MGIKDLLPGKKNNIKNAVPIQATAQSKTASTQMWLPINDIRNGLVYRKDGYILAAVRIQPININLLSVKERKRKVKQLEGVLNGIDYQYQIFCIGKPVDLDSYIVELETLRADTDSILKKRLLGIYSRQAVAKATSGEAIERHFYMIIDQKLSKKPQLDEQVLLQRAVELASNMSSAELLGSVCSEIELRTLNFIFTTPAQSSYERAPTNAIFLPPIVFAEEVYGNE
jgi:hypothetical protein